MEDKMVSIAQAWKRDAKLEGRLEGEQIGMQKGELRNKLQMAKKMLRFGEDIKKIALFTGLSVERIKRLQ
jgi:predicted transposase/invertase (TIGR01784 family)